MRIRSIDFNDLSGYLLTIAQGFCKRSLETEIKKTDICLRHRVVVSPVTLNLLQARGGREDLGNSESGDSENTQYSKSGCFESRLKPILKLSVVWL